MILILVQIAVERNITIGMNVIVVKRRLVLNHQPNVSSVLSL